MWTILLLLAGAAALALLARLTQLTHGLKPFQCLAAKNNRFSWVLAALAVALAGLTISLLVNAVTAAVALIHLLLIWELCQLAGRLWERIRHRPFSRDAAAIAAAILTVICLGTGWYMAHHIFETHYSVGTDKPSVRAPIRIVEIADAHLGTTLLDGEAFAEQIERVQALEPDAVMIVGDFVDDNTRAMDVDAACAALGRLKTRLGVYYVMGNHDGDRFGHRDFTADQLRASLTDNGVIILEDGIFYAGSGLCVVGRRDRSEKTRMDIGALVKGADPDSYIVVLDHQPNDYAAEAAAGVDLVLSGHTHGGHLWPAGLFGLLIGANDRVYGMEVRDNTTFIVTSGISGWGVPIKTGTFSEFVVIDICPRQNPN